MISTHFSLFGGDTTCTRYISYVGIERIIQFRIIRIYDNIDICRITGSILLDSQDIYEKKQDPVLLRARVGMVFQKPNPFPKSIYDNVAYGPRIHGLTKNKAELDDLVEDSLIKAGLFNEVKDRLASPGTGLSGGQQQRLCIARTLSLIHI